MSEIMKKRSITKEDSNVKAILYAKLQQYQEQNLPIEILTDYIGKGLVQIEDEIVQLKNYKSLIDDKIKGLQEQIKNVKIQSAEFLRENGIDKLDGVEFSSITITAKKDGYEEKQEVKTFHTDLTEDEINDFLVTQNLGHYTKENVTKIVLDTPEMVKVNKKRQKNDNLAKF